MLAAGAAYRCYATPGRAHRDAREGARARAARGSTTGAGATAIRPRRRPASKPVIRLKAPLDRRDRDRGPGAGPRGLAEREPRRFRAAALRRQRRPTCSRSWSTTTTWASPTSSAATTISPMPRARRRSTTRSAGTVPVMAHIPLIHGPDGAKLSKRHGALGVEAYRAMGYLPATMRNYLVRLGWSHGDQEIFSTEEMIAAFDLPQIGRSPARFDFAKLESLNGHYIRQTAGRRAAGRDRAHPAAHRRRRRSSRPSSRPTCAQRLLAAMPGLKERAKTLVELLDGARYFWSRTAAPARRQGGRPADRRRRARCCASSPTHLGAVDAWDAGSHRAGGPRLCRAQGHQARQGGAAAARRLDRAHDLAADLRRAGRARPRREPRPPARPDLRPSGRRRPSASRLDMGLPQALHLAAHT